MRKHVVIAVPAYVGTVHLITMRALLNDVATLVERGDKVTFDDVCCAPELRDNRAAMAARFLKGDGTHFVSVDHDIAWEKGALVRLVDYPVDVVGGVYPRREEPISYPVRYLQDRPHLVADPETGLLEVEGCPGGFVRYTRACFERMAEAYRDLEYRRSSFPDLVLPGFWREVFADGFKYGEDYSFFHRWRAIGGKVWVDPEISMVHVGQKAFIGHFGDWLRNRTSQ